MIINFGYFFCIGIHSAVPMAVCILPVVVQNISIHVAMGTRRKLDIAQTIATPLSQHGPFMNLKQIS